MGAAVALAAFTAQACADEIGPDLPSAQIQPAHTTVGSGELAADGIVSLSRLPQAIPALTLTPSWNSLTSPLLYLRGEGLDDPSSITRDGPVGVYEDGFPIARGEALAFDFLNLAEVQVLESPSLLAARNSAAGAINLVSEAPAGELSFNQLAQFGNRNAFRVLSSLDTPTWHGLSAKLTLLASSIDGSVVNPLPPGVHIPTADAQKFAQQSERAGRLQLRWDGPPGLSADYFIERNELDSTPLYDSNPALNGQGIFGSFPSVIPYEASSTRPDATYRFVVLPESTSRHLAQGLTVGWHPSEALFLKSLTAYRTLGVYGYQDYAEAIGYMESDLDQLSHHQFSEQLTLEGSVLGGQVSYLLGGSYLRERGFHETLFDQPSIFGSGLEIDRLIVADGESQAGFAGLSLRPDLLGRHLELTVAGRYTRDLKDAERFLSSNTVPIEDGAATGAVNRLSEHRTNPTATLTYRITDDIRLYARGASGYQPGAALESALPKQFASSAYTFQPDKEVTYEAGLASQLFDERLEVKAAAFETRYQNLQYAVPYVVGVEEINTIQKARVRGADLDLRLTVPGSLVLGVRGAYLRPSIERADVEAGSILDPASQTGSPYTVGENVADLYQVPYAPKYRLTSTGDYTFLHLDRRDLTAHLDYAYQAQVFSTAAAGPAVPGYQLDTIPAFGVLDAHLTLTQETDFRHHVKISLFGENVLNRKYFLLAGGVGPGGIGTGLTPVSSGTPAGLAGYTSRAVAWAPPPTYGVSFTYEY
jgi:iron complex outermembrane receptor protein